MTFAKSEDSKQGFGGYLLEPTKNPACCTSASIAFHLSVCPVLQWTGGLTAPLAPLRYGLPIGSKHKKGRSAQPLRFVVATLHSCVQ